MDVPCIDNVLVLQDVSVISTETCPSYSRSMVSCEPFSLCIADNGVNKYITLRFLLSGMLETENYIGIELYYCILSWLVFFN